MKKKLISILLILAMAVTNAGLPAFASEKSEDIPVSQEVSVDEQQNFNEDEEVIADEDEEVIVDEEETEELVYEEEPTEDTEVHSEENISLYASGQDITADLASGGYTIDSTGGVSSYYVSGAISNPIIVKSGTTAELTIDGTTWTPAAFSPITVETKATLTLHLVGINVFNVPTTTGFAGIAVLANNTTDDFATLIIDGGSDGTGSLELTGSGAGTTSAPAIGGNAIGRGGSTAPMSGKIIINGGNITATGGLGSAAIGGVLNSQRRSECCDIEINGGTIIANGGRFAPGIGGDRYKYNGKITINGGYVKAQGGTLTTGGNAAGIGIGNNAAVTELYSPVIINGGSVDAVISDKLLPIKDMYGRTLTQIKLLMPSSANAANKEVQVGTWTATTDGDAAIYPYIPVMENETDTTIFGLKYNGKLYTTEKDTIANINNSTLKEYTGGDCSCTTSNAKIQIDFPTSITVNKRKGVYSRKLLTSFIPNESCEYPLHGDAAAYDLSIDGVSAADMSQYAEISDGSLIVYYDQASEQSGRTLHLTAHMTNDGKDYVTNHDITVKYDDSTRFDLSEGSITITENSSDSTKIDVKVGDAAAYVVPKTEKVYISQATNSTTNIIDINTSDVHLVFEEINVRTTTDNILLIEENNNVTIELVGDNTLNATAASVFKGKPTANIIIEGTGSLTSRSGVGAGIGPMGSLTVNSGTVYAYGGGGGAGIGGMSDGEGKSVIVNGGKVYAYGNGNGAGIGGGRSNSSGKGGSFVMNGGTVVAQSEANGMGIGGGGVPSFEGTIQINGGSLNAKMYSDDPSHNSSNPKNKDGVTLYRLTLGLEGLTEEADVEYAVGSGEPPSKISASTDENGKIYLYLPAGKQFIRVYYDNKVYYKYIEVVRTNDAEGTAILNPTAEIEKFNIAGQVEDTVIDQTNNTISVKLPYNIMMDNITPDIEYNGSEIYYEEDGNEILYTGSLPLDFSSRTRNFLVMGEDMQKRKYTVTIELDGEPETPSAAVFDLSKGNVVITDGYVEYGGNMYQVNNLGYIITSSGSTNHTISIDAENELPPITFKDINISTFARVSPVIIKSLNNDISINVEGNNTISSISTPAISIDSYSTQRKVSFTGDGALNVQGGYAAPAIDIVSSDNTLEITGPATSIVAGMGRAALGSSGGSNGHFITDSVTNIRIADADGVTSAIQPVNSNGDPLYQLTVVINAADKTKGTCTYNGNEYKLGNDATFYLMVPNNTYDISVTYDGDTYGGTAEINGAGETVTVRNLEVDKIIYDDSNLTFAGGDIDVEVQGSFVAGNVKIKAVPDNSDYPTVESDVAPVNGKNIATIHLPNNPSYSTDVIYTLYYVIKGVDFDSAGKVQSPQTGRIILSKDTSVCRLNKFSIAGQIGSTTISHENNLISVRMPYDHEFKEYYAPDEFEFIGKGIAGNPSPEDVPVQYAEISTASTSYMRTFYEVESWDDDTPSVRYEVRIYHETVPQITSLDFNNTLPSSGGQITVTVRGTALGSIRNAEKEENKTVTVYSDDDSSITAQTKDFHVGSDGVYTYVLTVTVPSNSSDTEDKVYELKAKIGSTEQTLNSSYSVKVQRNKRSLTGLQNFVLENQLSSTIQDNNVEILMPYDADITSVIPSNVILEDAEARYEPTSPQDFTNPKTYTVIAEDGTRENYNVKVTKEPAPTVTDIVFTNPAYSSAGRVEVKINGQNLDNIAHSVNSDYITVSAVSQDSTTSIISANASKNNDGDYVAVLNIPVNSDMYNEKMYDVSVFVGDTIQTLSGNKTITVPRKELNSKEISDVFLVEGQSNLSITDNRIYIYVPYNTDLTNIKPVISHNGASCVPGTDDARNFNNVVTCTVTAEDGSSSVYEIYAIRNGVPKIKNITIDAPERFNDTEVSIDLTGDFVPRIEGNENDVITVSVIPRNGGNPISVTNLTYDSNVYGGHATASVTLPENTTAKDQIYDVSVQINGIEQPLGVSGIISVPARKTRSIAGFSVNGQVGVANIDETNHTITFTMPYSTDLTNIVPSIVITGDSIKVGGGEFYPDSNGLVVTPPQDFDKKEVRYTVSADGDEDIVYTVTAKRSGLPSVRTVTVENQPTTFKGSTVSFEVEGVFFYDAKLKVKCSDGTEIDANDITINMDENKKASGTIKLPENLDTVHDKIYTPEFYLDGFEDPISYFPQTNITVPRRKTRAITNFAVNNQVGSAVISENDIYIQVEYSTDLKNIIPTAVDIDGDKYSPEGAQNFDNNTNSLVYRVSADDDTDREYTVHISRSGTPEITNVTFTSPSTFRGGNVTVNIEGIFFKSAEVSAVADDGSGEIKGTTTSFEEGSASVTINLPVNSDKVNSKTYKLRFTLDGVPISYSGENEITVPRRNAGEITEFKLPEFVINEDGTQEGIQEGETRIEGTDIYITVPYHLDISSVTPLTVVYDSQKIEPAIDVSQNFNEDVQYKLSSAGDEDIIYTVHIIRAGEDPYIKTLTTDNQTEDTNYNGSNISLMLKSNANLKALEPKLDFVGKDYSPKGPQDFTNSAKTPLVYTVVNEYGIEKEYYVTIEKKRSEDGGGSRATAKSTPTPVPSETPEPTDNPSKTAEPTQTPDNTVKTMPYVRGYEEFGQKIFKPDYTITRAEVAAIMSVLDADFDKDTNYPNNFGDVADDAWYSVYVNYAAEKGYVNGYDDGLYRPENNITRAEFASIIARYIDAETYTGMSLFRDIDNIDWCRSQINALAELGIVNGYDDAMFMPNKLLTRAEAVVMINRAIDRVMTDEIKSRLNNPFSDVNSGHWAYDDILLASCEY